MNLLAAIACSFLAGCDGLHIVPAPTRARLSAVEVRWPLAAQGAVQDCSDDPHWGTWIDGRELSEGHGQDYYGKKYGEEVALALSAIYAKVKVEPSVELLSEIATLLHQKFKPQNKTIHKMSAAVNHCLMTTINETRRSAIMQDVIAMDEKFQYKKGDKEHQLAELFQEYNQMQKDATGSGEQMRAIAFLRHNLAFAHPFMDKNGRSRMILTAHELRRLNLGCGTFMYNNNRDSCFNTLDEGTEKLKEGISMYNIWQESGVNPWADRANKEKHLTNFAVSDKLRKCWHDWGQKSACRHKGCNHKGTSVE